MTGRILWSIRDDPRQKEVLAEFIAKKLNGHAEMDDATLTSLVQNYKQLAGVDPPGIDAVKDRGVFLITWRRSQSKTQLELAVYFQTIENRNKDHGEIGFHILRENDRNFCVAIVGGIGTYEWLLELLEADDGNSIDSSATLAETVESEKRRIADPGRSGALRAENEGRCQYVG